ncbi:MAG: non-ribosomal peptide synthetase, partial [Cyclobacteriaceae bacterium]
FAFFDDSHGNISITIEYSTELFTEDTVINMITGIEMIMRQMVAGSEQLVSDIELLTEAEKADFLKIAETTKADIYHSTVHALIKSNGEHYGERAAIEMGDQSVSYAELNTLSDKLAAKLQNEGLKKGDLVAISMERSPELIIAAVAALKAGGAYLPIASNFPADRKQYILNDSKATHLIIRSDSREQYAESEIAITTIDSVSDLEALTDTTFEIHNDELSASYAIYTSGSTGKPKGVLQTHRTMVNLADWQSNNFGYTKEQAVRTSQFAAISFDVSVQELFCTMINADTLILIPEDTKLNPAELIKFLSEEKIKVSYLPTAYLDYLCLEANKMSGSMQFPELDRIIVAGEALKITDGIRQFFTENDTVRLDNHYGPAETHVSTAYTLDKDPARWANIPSIGAPITNTTAYLFDEAKKLVPKGAIGELYIGGAGLAIAYLNNEVQTEERFIKNPYSDERLYKTGDLARVTRDGNYQFIGRSDQQVKIRGYRIEPGEVEARLSTYEALDQAAVIVKEIDNSLYLLAFYVAKEEIAQENLRSHLAAELPEYMIPAGFTRIDKIPLTQNGKTDKRSLAGLDTDFISGREYVAPANETEIKLADIWSELLRNEKISVIDNFFEVGGHSLLATQLISRINTEFKIEMHLSSLFKKPTIRGCAEIVADSEVLDNANSLTNFIDTEDELTF